MALPSGSTFSVAKCVRARIEYPFRDLGDAITKVYHHTMQQALSSYAPLADNDTMTTSTEKPDGSPFADDANAFFVSDTTLNEIDGGRVEWVRSFANIPQDLIVPNGFYAFEFPDVSGGIVLSKATTSEISSYNSSTFQLTITATLSTSDAANFNTGDVLTVYNLSSWTYTKNGSDISFTSITGVASKSGNTLTIIPNYLFYYTSGGTQLPVTGFTDNSAPEYLIRKQISPDRNGTAVINSPSYISHRYQIGRDVANFQLATPFQLSSSTGQSSNSTTVSTIPYTTAQYQEAALAGASIAAENETIEHWRGNIYRLSQIFVKMK